MNKKEIFGGIMNSLNIKYLEIIKKELPDCFLNYSSLRQGVRSLSSLTLQYVNNSKNRKQTASDELNKLKHKYELRELEAETTPSYPRKLDQLDLEKIQEKIWQKQQEVEENHKNTQEFYKNYLLIETKLFESFYDCPEDFSEEQTQDIHHHALKLISDYHEFLNTKEWLLETENTKAKSGAELKEKEQSIAFLKEKLENYVFCEDFSAEDMMQAIKQALGVFNEDLSYGDIQPKYF